MEVSLLNSETFLTWEVRRLPYEWAFHRYNASMSDVAKILESIDNDPQAIDELLPLVYQELRKLAATS